MKKLLSILSILFLAVCSFKATAQTTQNPVWTLPPYYAHFTSGPNIQIDPLPGLSIASYCSNAYADASGRLIFYIVDNNVFDGQGRLIGSFIGAITTGPYIYRSTFSVHPTHELCVVPVPGNCTQYYIFFNNVSSGGSSTTENAYYAVLDMSLPGLPGSAAPMGRLLQYSVAIGMGPDGNQTASYNCKTLFSNTTIPKSDESLFAASPLRSNGTRFVFAVDGYRNNVYRYVLSDSSLSAADTLFNFSSSESVVGQAGMELVSMSSGYSLAFPIETNAGNGFDEGVLIADLNTNGQLIYQGSVNVSHNSLEKPVINGLEFSPDGSKLYITHKTTPSYPNPIGYTNGSSYYSLNLADDSVFQYSQIELGYDGKLYFSCDSGLATLSGNLNGNPTLLAWNHDAVPINYPFASYGYSHYSLPDQIDGGNYDTTFHSSVECCINYDNYDIISDTVTAANDTWSPGMGNNPWSSTSGIISVKKDLVIPAGVDLTIQNMTFRFAPGAKVVIERGNGSTVAGRLTLDGTTFTADTDCNAQNMWLGVRVQGYQNNAMSNGTQINQQGALILKNNSVIENAYKGAVAAKVSPVGNPYTPSSFTYDYSYAGGWIQATNSSFINNVNDVEILNFDTANDLSSFTNCEFVTNHALNNPTLYPVYHAELVNVKNVRFSGCDFKNTTTVWSLSTFFKAGTGIYSEDAQYNVQARCLSFTLPCNNYDSCSFSGLDDGVYASNNLSSRTVSVDRAIFTNNITGIYLSTVDEATITRNNFHIPPVSQGFFNLQTVGSFLTNCTGYTVQENKLSGYSHNLNASTYGIIVDNSGAANNKIYKNTFTQLLVGGQSQGINASNSGSPLNDDGLYWECNTFNSPMYKASLTVTSGRISDHQGYQDSAADNVFNTPSSSIYDIWVNSDAVTNPDVMDFQYYWNVNNANTQPTPIYDPSLHIAPFVASTPTDINTCPSLLYSCCIVIGPFLQQLSTQSDSLNRAIEQKRSKIDGGNSVNMLNSIGASGRDILRMDLLNASPYLSDKVLLKYIETPLVPNDYKLQVLLANSPLSDTVMQVLNNFNLPNGIMQKINAAQTGISARTRLYDAISFLKRKLAYNRNTRLRIYLNDTTNSPASMDSVIAILQRENGEAARKQLCDVYIGMGNSSAATALKNEITAEYGSDDYTHLLGISLQLSQSHKGVFALKDSAALLAQVEQIAYSSTEKAASAKAKAMLSAALDTTFLPDVEPLTGTNNQRRAGSGNPQPKYAGANTLLIYPNPTDRNSGVVIALQSTDNAKMNAPTVKIYDVMGRLAAVYRMGGKQTKITVPTNELESGIYFVKLYFGDNYIETKKLVVK